MDSQGGSSSNNFHFRAIKRQDSFDMSYDPVISCGTVGSVTVVKPQPLTHMLDLDGRNKQTIALSKENTHISMSASSDVFKSCALSMDMPHASEAAMEQEPNRDLSSNSVSKCTDSLTNKGSTLTVVSPVSPENESSVVKVATPSNAQKQLIKDHTDLESNPKSFNAQHQGALPDQSEQSYSSNPPVNEGDSGIDPFSEGGEENSEPRGSEGSAGGSPRTEATDTGVSLPAAEASAASSKAEQQDKIKGEAFFLSIPAVLGITPSSFCTQSTVYQC